MNYIMILEDDEELAFGMEMALKDKDFSFTVCSTVKDAAAALKSQTFDLLLLDVNLPDGSGFAFCQDIRRESKVPIILLTARDMELDIVRGLECGADDYITKPFSTMVLRARIRGAAAQNQSQTGIRVYAGTFSLLLFHHGILQGRKSHRIKPH